MFDLRCGTCGCRPAPEPLAWQCDACGGALRYDAPAPEPARFLHGAGSGVWRYAGALPRVSPQNRVTLGEGQTPLVSISIDGTDVTAKLDYAMPTGSFKDRGSAVMLSCLKELGIRQITEDSSGNAGASVAAYCARSGIQGTVFIPAGTSLGKRAQIRSYGVGLVEVPGSRSDVAAAAILATGANSYYASHVWSPFFIEGTKTFAYELWEQLQSLAPEAMIMPVGAGTLLLGVYRGFADLLAAGLVDRVPRLYAVQAAGNCPLYRAFVRGLDDLEDDLPEPGPSMAEGIRVMRAPRAREILQAVRQTGGRVLVVDEARIQDAWKQLAGLGLLVEPTSAVGAAAVRQLAERGEAGRGQQVVLPLTGSGLKSLDHIGVMAARHLEAGSEKPM